MSDVETIDRAPVARPVLEGASAPAANAAFTNYVRAGATLEMKAFTGVTGDAGGYAIPKEIDATIDRLLKAASTTRCASGPPPHEWGGSCVRRRPPPHEWGGF